MDVINFFASGSAYRNRRMDYNAWPAYLRYYFPDNLLLRLAWCSCPFSGDSCCLPQAFLPLTRNIPLPFRVAYPAALIMGDQCITLTHFVGASSNPASQVTDTGADRQN